MIKTHNKKDEFAHAFLSNHPQCKHTERIEGAVQFDGS